VFAKFTPLVIVGRQRLKTIATLRARAKMIFDRTNLLVVQRSGEQAFQGGGVARLRGLRQR